MIYVCEICKFLFERISEPEQCPDCGKYAIREATEEEKAEYVARCEEFGRDCAEHNQYRKNNS